MTNEEAEKVLTDELKVRVDGYQSYLQAYGKADNEEENYLDALENAINALKKMLKSRKSLKVQILIT